MLKIVESVKYQLQVYMKGSRFIMPLVVTVVIMYMMYSMSPVDVVGSFCMNCYVVFLIMAWIGFSASASENAVMEQIQFLRVQSVLVYYSSKVLFVFVLGILMDCICVVLPLLQHILHAMGLFNRQLTGYDVLNAFLLLAGCSFAGGALGCMLHPCVMRNRKTATLLALLAVVLTIIQSSVTKEFSFMKAVTWVLPPIDRIMNEYRYAEYFQLAKTNRLCLVLLLYGVAYSVIKSVICHIRKFG